MTFWESSHFTNQSQWARKRPAALRLLPLTIILHKRILAAQLLKHILGILLRAVTDVGIGNGGLEWDL